MNECIHEWEIIGGPQALPGGAKPHSREGECSDIYIYIYFKTTIHNSCRPGGPRLCLGGRSPIVDKVSVQIYIYIYFKTTIHNSCRPGGDWIQSTDVNWKPFSTERVFGFTSISWEDSQGGVCSCGEQEYTKLVPKEPTESKKWSERERRNS